MIKYPLKSKAEGKGSLRFINEYAQRTEFMKRIKDSYFLAMLKGPPPKADGALGEFKKGDKGTDFKSYYLGETDINDVYHQSGATYMLLRIVNGEDRSSETITARGRRRAGASFLKKYEEQSIVANVDWLLCRYENDKGIRYAGIPAAEYVLSSAEKNEYIRHTETVAVAQCLKLFMQAYLAHKSGKIVFNDAKENYYTPHFEKRIELVIKHCLACLNAGFLKPGDMKVSDMGDNFWCGWNYKPNDAKRPSLFFTYFVLEAFMETEDIVNDVFFAESEDGGAQTNAFSATAFYSEYTDFEQAARTAGYTLWMEHKDVLAKGFFTEGTKQHIAIADVLDKGASNAPFNALFVILSAIYSSVNKILEKDKPGGRIDKKLKEDLIELKKKKGTDTLENYSNVIQSIMPVFDSLIKEATDKGKLYKIQDYIAEIEKDWLKDNVRSEPKANREIDEFNMFDRLLGATLIPLLTRANNLYAFYIAKYPKKDISGYFDMLTDSRLVIKDATYHFEQAVKIGALDVAPASKTDFFEAAYYNDYIWLWGASGNFDVHASDKAINAVIDFYEYYDEFENPYIEPELKNKKLEEKFTKDLSEIKAESAKKLEKLEQKFKEEKNELSASFHIENAIVKKIEDVFAAKKEELERGMQEAIKKFFADALNREYDLNEEKRFGNESTDKLIKYFMSSLFGGFDATVAKNNGYDIIDIKEKLDEKIIGLSHYDEIKNKHLKSKKED